MSTRIALIIVAAAGICIAMPVGAEELGVGVTVGSGHVDRDGDRDKKVIIKKDRDDKKVVIKKDRDHDGDVDKKVIIKKDND